MYHILDDMKDGAATTSKYDNQRIKFLTQNYVMVFSNSFPNMKHLSKDRWQIFETTDNDLKPMDKERIVASIPQYDLIVIEKKTIKILLNVK